MADASALRRPTPRYVRRVQEALTQSGVFWFHQTWISNGRDEQGNTPLIEAARFGHDELVTALLVAKADVNAKNDQGKTALVLAAEGGHDQTARTLTQAGAGR